MSRAMTNTETRSSPGLTLCPVKTDAGEGLPQPPANPTRAIRALLDALIAEQQNPETGLEQGAITAAAAGRAAFWRRTRYSDSATALLVYWANIVGLVEGVRRVRNFAPGHVLTALDNLIPLNQLAAASLPDVKERARWAEAETRGRVA